MWMFVNISVTFSAATSWLAGGCGSATGSTAAASRAAVHLKPRVRTVSGSQQVRTDFSSHEHEDEPLQPVALPQLHLMLCVRSLETGRSQAHIKSTRTSAQRSLRAPSPEPCNESEGKRDFSWFSCVLGVVAGWWLSLCRGLVLLLLGLGGFLVLSLLFRATSQGPFASSFDRGRHVPAPVREGRRVKNMAPTQEPKFSGTHLRTQLGYVWFFKADLINTNVGCWSVRSVSTARVASLRDWRRQSANAVTFARTTSQLFITDADTLSGALWKRTPRSLECQHSSTSLLVSLAIFSPWYLALSSSVASETICRGPIAPYMAASCEQTLGTGADRLLSLPFMQLETITAVPFASSTSHEG